MAHGFPDDDVMLVEFGHAQALAQLEVSAVLYVELYEDDPELQELAELALERWPE